MERSFDQSQDQRNELIDQSYRATLDYANEKFREQNEDIDISMDPVNGSCPRCSYYEQELVTLRGMEVVWRLKHAEEMKHEWEKLHTLQTAQIEHNERLKAELEETKLACVQYAKNAEINAALAQKLQEEIQVVRTENENLLTTIQETFHTYSKTELNSNVCKSADILHKNKKQKIVVQYSKKPAVCRVNNIKSDKKTVKCKKEIEDEDSDADMLESEDDDDSTHVNGYLETKHTDLKSEEPICLWTEPGQHPCHEMFQSMQEMREHVKKEHILEGSVHCLWKNCAKKGHVFKQNRSIIGHIVLHTSDSLYKCKSAGCGKSFAYKSQFVKHSRIHDSCKPKIPKQENVMQHKQLGIQVYQCPHLDCDGIFTHKDALTRHEQCVHAPVKMCVKKLPSHKTFQYRKQVVRESYRCQISSCGKTFMNHKEFLNHRVQHVCQQPVRCTILDCNRLFVSKYKLDRHCAAMHASDKPLTCLRCSEVFATRYELQHHIKMFHVDT